MKYTESIKSGFPVVDEVIYQHWDLVKEYVKKAEDWERGHIEYNNKKYSEGIRGFKKLPDYKPWGDREKLISAISCVSDYTKAMGTVITKEDTLVQSFMTIIDGCLQGTATIKRDGKEYSFTTSSHYAGGWNIQCYHMRYRIKTDLPKTKLPKDALLLLEKEQSALRSILAIENSIERYKKELQDNISLRDRIEEESREQLDKRITEEEIDSLEKGYIGKGGYFSVYWSDSRKEQQFKTFEEYLPQRCQSAWESSRGLLEIAKRNIEKFTKLIEQYETSLDSIKKKFK